MKIIIMYLIYSVKCSLFGIIKKKDLLLILSYSLVVLFLMKILRFSWRSRYDISFNFFFCERYIRVTDNLYYGCFVFKFGNGFVLDLNRNVGL